jgi:recombination protein RecA
MTNAKLISLMTDLQKAYGEDTVMMASAIPQYPSITSGSLALDFAVGNNGMPSDRVIEISGKEGSGKTTLAILTMIQFLDNQPDKGALILDIEHKLGLNWLEFLIGPERLERVIYIQPDHAEQATNVYKAALRSGQICFALFDSIGGAPTARRNDDAEVASYGGNAIAITEFARSAATLSSKYRCLTVGINQTRDDFGGYNRLITPGGNAWKHACVLRIELVKSTKEIEYATIKNEKIPIGHMVYAKIRKNQLNAPGRTASWWFYSVPTEEKGFGIDTQDEVIRLGVATEVLRRTGGWYHHPAFPQDAKGEHKVQGLEQVKSLVRSDESLRQTLTSEILASLDDHANEIAPISDPDSPVLVENNGGS